MDFVQYSTDGPVALIRLDRPPMNALSSQMALELHEAFLRARDHVVRAVVVTGQPHFAAGADIKGFQKAFDAGERDVQADHLLEAVNVLDTLPKPTVAAVHGFALGGGCELSLGCDFRFMAEDAHFGQPEIQLGLIPGAGGTQRLQRIVGYQKAKDLIFSGRHVGAEEALGIGYADKVLPAEDLLESALEFGSELAARPTVAIAAAKRALAAGWNRGIEEGQAIETEGFQKTFASEDGAEGVVAFIEKRKPTFKGR